MEDSVTQDAPHYRWNFLALTGDAAAYFVGLAFLDAATVLPVFFRRACEALGSSHLLLQASVLVGLAQAVQGAGWLIPQFFSARSVRAGVRRKPLILRACARARLPTAGLCIFLFFPAAASQHILTIVVVLAIWTAFWIGEGSAGVPWTELVSETIPARRRGRLFATMQIVSGVLAAYVGILVGHLLGRSDIAFPRNFAYLFAGFSGMMLVSLGFLLALRENPVKQEPDPPTPFRDYVRELPVLWRADAAFRKVMIVQLIGSLRGLAAPLYTLFAVQQLHVPEQSVGGYISAINAGSVVGSLLMGYLNDRVGPRTVVRLNLLSGALTPLTALVIGLLALNGWMPHPSVRLAFGVVFFLSGIGFATSWTGFTSYVLEAVNPERRARYVGLMNTMAAPAVLLPLLGPGLAALFSPLTVFLVAGIGGAAGLVNSRKLPSYR